MLASPLSAATLHVSQASTNPIPPYATWETAASSIQPAVDAARAGDTVLVANGIYTGGVVVTNPVAVRSLNGPQVTVIQGGGPCVSLAGLASLTGFTLTNGIADIGGGGLTCASAQNFLTNCVMIGNSGCDGGGVHGGTLYNCTLAGNSASYGGGACGSVLYSCILTNNYATWGPPVGGIGGGAYGSTLYNCALSGNLAYHGGGAYNSTLYLCTVSSNDVQGLWFRYAGGDLYVPGAGGGVSGSTLYSCTLIGNSAAADECGGGDFGGGAVFCTLYNCVLTGNSADEGGGAVGGALYGCTVTGNSASFGGGVAAQAFNNPTRLYNCVVYYNTASGGANYDSFSVLNYCCTTPMPGNGVGNIDLPPLFRSYSGGDLRLQPGSPCINAGNNAFPHLTVDVEGNPRIVQGSIDIGAYEFQGTGSLVSYAWLGRYGLATDGSADFIDSDGDGMNNWEEWICGTCPTNHLSALRLLSPRVAGTNLTITWQSVAGVNYFLTRATNPAAPFICVATNISGQSETTSYTETNTVRAGSFFYRVGVRGP